MNGAMNGLDVKYNDFPRCVCGNPATTCRPAVSYEGPGKHPFTDYWTCAHRAGGNWLEDGASCFCGFPKYRTYTVCKRCRQNAPCRMDGCDDEGGKGTTDVHTSLCREHYNLARRIADEIRRNHPDCRRCGNLLFFNRKKGASDAAKNICTLANQPCVVKLKCVFQFDDETWCDKERASIKLSGFGDCYCEEHAREMKRKS